MTILAANWKMHGSMALIEAVAAIQSSLVASKHQCLFFPPFPLIMPLQLAFAASPSLAVGAQNVSEHEFGAYTGEVSAAILAEQGVRYVLVGHSERRQYYGESNQVVAAKALRAQSHDIVPIVCIGERLEQKEQQQTMVVLSEQIQALTDAGVVLAKGQIVIAYEPVWAIGTGLAASPEAITEVHGALRGSLGQLGGEQAKDIDMLYGGSVNAENAQAILSLAEVDGALIGGASLKVDQLLAMAEQN